MKHERKKPEETSIERSNREFENERIILGKQSYELGRIRGRKEMIVEACEWIFGYIRSNDMKKKSAYDVERDFREAMESNYGEFATIKTCNTNKNLQELTWEDVKKIAEIADKALGQFGSRSWLASEEAYYTEVLRRFKEEKK